jgi:hypothetical protein
MDRRNGGREPYRYGSSMQTPFYFPQERGEMMCNSTAHYDSTLRDRELFYGIMLKPRKRST